MEKNNSSINWMRILDYSLRRDSRMIALNILFILFCATTLFMALYHIPWRDEAQPWLFARDLNLWGLFIEARHNGHPILWWLCIKGLQAIGLNYLGMMILNWLFISIAIWLLFYRSALPLLARLGVAFSPICLLEIAFTARDYAIAILLCFLAAVFYKNVREKPIRYSIVLALLANTNIYAFAVSAGITFQFLLEQSTSFGTKSLSIYPLYKRFLFPNLIQIAGVVLLVIQLAPIHFPGDHIATAVSTLTPSFEHLWKHDVFIVFLLLLALLLFAKKPAHPLILGVLVIILIAAVPAIAYGCFGRHAFMIALGLIYFCWIYFDSIIEGSGFCGIKISQRGTKYGLISLIILTSFVCIPNKPYNFKLEGAFDSRSAAKMIIKQNLDSTNTLIVVSDPFRAMPLLLFLKNIRAVYAPPEFGESPQSYAQDTYLKAFFNSTRSLEKIRPLVIEIGNKNPTKIILVAVLGVKGNLDFPKDDSEYQLVPVYESPNSIFDESYHIYKLIH